MLWKAEETKLNTVFHFVFISTVMLVKFDLGN